MGQTIAVLCNNCLGRGPEQEQENPKDSSDNSSSEQPKPYDRLVEKFEAAMTNHMLVDKCSGRKFHKDDLCNTCMRLAVEADIENGYFQPGGPYGFTKLGFSTGFNLTTYYNADYPEPTMSPRCAKHFPTLENKQQRYGRCSGLSPVCNRGLRPNSLAVTSEML